VSSVEVLLTKFIETFGEAINGLRSEISTLSARMVGLEKLEVKDSTNLEHHMARTAACEARIDTVEEKLEGTVQEMRKKVDKLQVAVSGWRANLQLAAWVITTGLIVAGLILRLI